MCDRPGAAVLFALLLTGCPDQSPPLCDAGDCSPAIDAGTCDLGTYATATGECVLAGWSDCPTGFITDHSAAGCVPIVPHSDCPAGTMPIIGKVDCTPVGWTACPTGFATDPSGWGCAAIVPATACTGATREAIGNPACQPIGDCTAAFPTTATIFVDDSFTAAQLDATHFASIGAAVTAAPLNAVIAIEAGTYREHLSPTRALSLVGRCPAQVTIIGSNPPTPAFDIDATRPIVISNVTIRDSDIAIRVGGGGGVMLQHAVLEANRISAVQAVDANTTLWLDDVAVRGTLPETGGNFGQGVAAGNGAALTLTGVSIVDNREAGLFLNRAPTRAEISNVLISGTRVRTATGSLGFGAAVQAGAELVARSSLITDNFTAGVLVAQANSHATLSDVVVRGTRVGKDSAGTSIATNIAVQPGARLDFTGGALVDGAQVQLNLGGAGAQANLSHVVVRGMSQGNPAPRALYAGDHSTLTVSQSAIIDAVGSGIDSLDDSTVTLDTVLVGPVAQQAGVSDTGTGVRAQSASLTGAHVVVRRASAAAAVAMFGGQLALADSLLLDTQPSIAADAGSSGFGVSAQTGGSASLERCSLERNAVSGAYATGAGSALTLSGTQIRDTAADVNGEFGQGVICEQGAVVQLTDVGVFANRNAGAQVDGLDSAVGAVRVTIRGTLADGTGHRGRGVNAQVGGSFAATASVLQDNRQVGVFVYGAKVVLTDSFVLGTFADPDGAYGNGVEVVTDGVATVTRGSLASNAGIAAVLAEGAGSFDGVRIANNTVGLHTQDGTTLSEVDVLPMSIDSRQVAVTRSTVFIGNTARLGSGTVPVPPR